MTDEEFEYKIRQMKEGYRLWNWIIEKNEMVKDGYIIVFPHCNHPVNEEGMKYLDLFIQIRKPEKVVILCQCEEIHSQIASRNVPDIGVGGVYAEMLSETEMECLLACYSGVNLSERLIIMSLTEPMGRYGEKVIDSKKVDIGKVVLLGIYGLSKEEAQNEI